MNYRMWRQWLVLTFVVATAGGAVAQQKIDEERMARDIEVAENVLGTLLRQQMKRNFFPVEAQGNYLPGYGVTFRLPSDFGAMLYMSGSQPRIAMRSDSYGGFAYTIEDSPELVDTDECNDCPKRESVNVNTTRTRRPARAPGLDNPDSAAERISARMVAAAKDFLADYGDMISQLAANEKIVVTNRAEGNQRFWLGQDMMPKRTMLSVEATKGDLTQYKQGKLTRDQLLAKFHVVNTETTEETSPDLELMTTIIDRLYRSDLSKSFFIEEGTYFERLKDYGVIYYMQVFSSHQQDQRTFRMPTLGLEDVDPATRNKKVKELYPVFLNDIKSNMVEYGRTLRTLKDDEQLVFSIRMTKCDGCGIPASLELSVKESVLKEYNQGKITQEAAMAKIAVKNGPAQ